jgi:hypothetical protein
VASIIMVEEDHRQDVGFGKNHLPTVLRARRATGVSLVARNLADGEKGILS